MTFELGDVLSWFFSKSETLKKAEKMTRDYVPAYLLSYFLSMLDMRLSLLSRWKCRCRTTVYFAPVSNYCKIGSGPYAISNLLVFASNMSATVCALIAVWLVLPAMIFFSVLFWTYLAQWKSNPWSLTKVILLHP